MEFFCISVKGNNEKSIICLPYTGYDWVKNIALAKENGVIISNTPNYSTNAVAEHHLALILDCAKHITCINNDYKNGKEVPYAILTSTTSGIVYLEELNDFLKDNKLFGIGLDDVDQQQVPQELLKHDNVVCTYHRAYNTKESENNRINLCIDSIEAFIKNKPINQI